LEQFGVRSRPETHQDLLARWHLAGMWRRAFTLIELLLVVVILGALAALAIPNLQRVVERARVTKAIADVKILGQEITEYWLKNNMYPNSLADVDRAGFIDPWGNPYQYLAVEGASRGQLRKDRFLVPVNSDFDLYSMGPDGLSRPPFTARASQDDIVRANDGGFVGIADDY
jgi:general secretion pathway protein G